MDEDRFDYYDDEYSYDGGGGEYDDEDEGDYNSDDEESVGPEFEQTIVDFINDECDLETLLSTDGPIIENRDGDNSTRAPANTAARRKTALRKLKSDLREYTRVMEGPCDMNFIILQPNTRAGHCWMQYDDDGLKIAPDSSFDSYWRKFSIALRGCDEDRFENCEITSIQLTPVVLKMLVPAIKVQNLQELKLNDNNLSPDGFKLVASFLEGNSSLVHLNLSSNTLDDLDAATHLSNAMAEHSTLANLEMDRCDLGKNTTILSVLLQSNLGQFGLNNNEIGSSGATEICNFIKRNPPTTNLSMNSNNFTDEDATLFSKALKKNSNLGYVQLFNNKFSRRGQKAILMASFDTTSMKSVMESNHSCSVWLSWPFNAIQNINYYESAERNKEMKIFLALRTSRSGHFNTKYLDDVPLALIPEVILLLLCDDREQHMLTKIFQLVKGWKMQSLFIGRNKGRNKKGKIFSKASSTKRK